LRIDAKGVINRSWRNGIAVSACASTHLGASAAAFTWMAVEEGIDLSEHEESAYAFDA
jgi:ammonia channel protein AmtB